MGRHSAEGLALDWSRSRQGGNDGKDDAEPAQRKALAEEIQRGILEKYYFVPVFRHAFVNVIGPRIAATKWQDVFPTAITTAYCYPWEDIQLKG